MLGAADWVIAGELLIYGCDVNTRGLGWRMYAPVVPQASNTDPKTYTLCHMVSSMSKKRGDRWQLTWW